MKLKDEWFSTIAENENGKLIFITGREDLSQFRLSGKFNERVEIHWQYTDHEKGMPTLKLGELMEQVQEALRKSVEKNKLAILTGIYTGDNERTWIFYTRTTQVFCEHLNEALDPFELLPITLYSEKDELWEEYLEMSQMKTLDETNENTESDNETSTPYSSSIVNPS